MLTLFLGPKKKDKAVKGVKNTSIAFILHRVQYKNHLKDKHIASLVIDERRRLQTFIFHEFVKVTT
jgi:hypothetical protein